MVETNEQRAGRPAFQLQLRGESAVVAVVTRQLVVHIAEQLRPLLGWSRLLTLTVANAMVGGMRPSREPCTTGRLVMAARPETISGSSHMVWQPRISGYHCRSREGRGGEDVTGKREEESQKCEGLDGENCTVASHSLSLGPCCPSPCC